MSFTIHIHENFYIFHMTGMSSSCFHRGNFSKHANSSSSKKENTRRLLQKLGLVRILHIGYAVRIFSRLEKLYE